MSGFKSLCAILDFCRIFSKFKQIVFKKKIASSSEYFLPNLSIVDKEKFPFSSTAVLTYYFFKVSKF